MAAGGVEIESVTSSDAAGERGNASRWHRILDAVDERLGLKALTYPIPEHANKLAYSLGGLSLITFLLLLVTGIVLANYYHPDPTVAHASIRHIITGVTLGGFVRAFHYWASMAMIVFVGLHLLRVFATGAFKRPREGNWIIGVVLLAVSAGFFFTGTVLKWDQEAIEALEHNIEVGKLLGRFGFWFSPSFGGIPMLHRLYTVHVTVLPMVFLFLVTVHLMLVKRHGMATSPFRKGPVLEPTEPFTRHLARLGGFALAIIGAVTVLAVLIPPTHGPSPVSGIEITKPPWPMLWIYPIENWMGVSGILWATLVFFAALLIVPFVDRGQEQRPSRRLTVVVPAALLVTAILGLIVYAAVTPVATHIGM